MGSKANCDKHRLKRDSKNDSTSNTGISHMTNPSYHAMNVVMDTFEAVTPATTVTDSVIAECRPSGHPG